jgi:preprotein translocase subunit YajC
VITLTSTFPLLQAAGEGAGSLAPFLFQILAIGGIVYFFMIRPQQKQRKQHEERLRNLRRGDIVVTAGGIVGEVMHLKETQKEGGPEKTMEDQITIKSAESRLLVERGRIARVLGSDGTTGTASIKP